MRFQIHDIQLYDQSYFLFGRNGSGESVSLLVRNHPSYFYMKPKTRAMGEREPSLQDITEALNGFVENRLKLKHRECRSYQCNCNNSDAIGEFGPDLVTICSAKYAEFRASKLTHGRYVHLGEKTLGKSIVGYQVRPENFAQIVCRTYGVERMIKFRVLEQYSEYYEIMELGLDPIMRFMSDFGIVGFGFVEVDNAALITPLTSERHTTCTMEYVLNEPKAICTVENIENYPVHFVSYDIECCTLDKAGGFPNAAKDDPVIQIGVVAQTLFNSEPDSQPECQSEQHVQFEKRVVFCLKETNAIVDFETGEQRAEIVCFDTELELLKGFFEYCNAETTNEDTSRWCFEADIVAGFNSNQFDMPYLLKRAERLGYKRFKYFSKLKTRQAYTWKHQFQSAQTGTRTTQQYNTPGVFMLDVFNYIKKTMKLQSYSLNNVALEILGDKKEDMEYKNITPYFLEGPDKRAILASYCLQDTVLVARLIDTQKILVNNIEFSRICGIRLQDCFEKGVSYKILRKLLEYTRKEGFLIPTFQRDPHTRYPVIEYYDEIVNDKAEYQYDCDMANMKSKGNKKTAQASFLTCKRIDSYFKSESSFQKHKRKHQDVSVNSQKDSASQELEPRRKRLKFQGAYVLPPKRGFHNNCVSTLDFASLYPNLMRANNICVSTLLQSHEHARELGLRNDEYKEVAAGFLYVTKAKFEGILPKIETELFNTRKAVKQELKAAQAQETKNQSLIDVLDGKQLAIKLIMNSIYGFCGSRTSPLAALPVAISITAKGREEITRTKSWVEQHFKTLFPEAPGPAEVVYGDSVIGETPFLVRFRHLVYVLNIFDIEKDFTVGTWKYMQSSEKEYVECTPGLEVWSDDGWTKLIRLIRHICNKQVVVVDTHVGSVTCTTDHSLLMYPSSCPVSPSDCIIGQTSLLHKTPCVLERKTHDFVFPCGRVLVHRVVLDEDLARVMGMFVGDGTCDNYECKKGTWAICNSDTAVLSSYQQVLETLFPFMRFVICNTMPSTGCHMLQPRSSRRKSVLVDFVRWWRGLTYHDDGEKKIAPELYTSEHAIQTAFLHGLRDSDATKTKSELEVTLKGHRVCQGVATLAYLSGKQSVVLKSCSDKPGIFTMRVTNDSQLRKPKYAVKKITPYEHKGYVYDLTTTNHHFQAGIGTMIVHNTDSVMVKFHGVKDVHVADKYASVIEQRINHRLQKGEEKNTDGIDGLYSDPMKLEFEKTFMPYFLLGKKKYIGLKYAAGGPDKEGELSYSGVELARRDWCKLCTVTQAGFISRLILEGDKKAAVDYVRSRVQSLSKGEIAMGEFVLSKKLSKRNYAFKQPHVEVAKILEKKDPLGNSVQLGDRIEYIIFKTDSKKLAERARPLSDYGELPVDKEYYLEKQLKGPMLRLLNPLLPEKEAKRVFNFKEGKETRKQEQVKSFNRLFFGSSKKKATT